MHFMPKDLRLFSQDNKSIYIYPNISLLTNNLERIFVWFTTLTNINNSAYDETFKYLVLGTITETSSDITSFFNAFCTFALDYIKDHKNLTVLSYHGANGLHIPSTVDGSGQLESSKISPLKIDTQLELSLQSYKQTSNMILRASTTQTPKSFHSRSIFELKQCPKLHKLQLSIKLGIR